MEQIALVQAVFPDGTAEVVRIVEETCPGNCALCGGCPEQKPFRVQNPIGATAGDRVVLAPVEKVARKTAAMLYTLPVVHLLAGYLLGEHYLGRGGLFGTLGGAIGLALVLLWDRKMSAKHPLTYHIVSLAQAELS